MADERARALEALRRDGARQLKASLVALQRDVAASIRLCSRDFGVLGRELVAALQQRQRREHAAAHALEIERRRRRRLQRQLVSAQGGLRVLCRVRPPLRHDDRPPTQPGQNPADTDSPKLKNLRVEVESEQELRVCSAVDGSVVKSFCFQRVFGEESTQERVFRDVAPLEQQQNERFAVAITLQLVEIYNEEVFDLLAPCAGAASGSQPPMQLFSPPSSSAAAATFSASASASRVAVEIRHGESGVYLKNVTTVA
ncbi:hypothetical protein PybrP1_010848, partial [[Pythium] brassicae (nom. inval.)]